VSLFPPATIAAVVFDHDGTLVDSLSAVAEATNRALVEHGFARVPDHEVVTGMSLATNRRMGVHARVEDAAEQATLAATFYRHARELAPAKCTLYPGVSELVQTLAGHGLPLAVVSNNQGVVVRSVMQKLGLLRFFTTVLGEEDAAAPKPDPRGLLRAAASMRREPWWCVYVGDSHPDCQAAHAAGMRAIGVTWGIHPRQDMTDLGFDTLVDSAVELLELIERAK
jgi:2-phosphoglycolate phosphatase